MYKQLPFAGCGIALHGFSEQETQHMREIASDNGICYDNTEVLYFTLYAPFVGLLYPSAYMYVHAMVITHPDIFRLEATDPGAANLY